MNTAMEGKDEGPHGFTDEEKRACSIDAMRNGEECEACQ